MTDNLFKCEHCKEMALADETETGILWTYIQKWISTSGDNVFSTVSSIFQKKEKSVLQDPNELGLEILSDKFTRIAVDSRSVCIGIKQLTDA